MRTREEYETKKAQFVEVKPAMLDINFRALTFVEQNVLAVLYFAQDAKTNSEIFELYLERVKKAKPTVEKFSYSTIRRMLEDFYLVGWVGKRRLKSKTLYFLNEQLEEKMKNSPIVSLENVLNAARRH